MTITNKWNLKENQEFLLYLSLYIIIGLIFIALALTGYTDADLAAESQKLSAAVDKFEITRRIVFYNGITGDYILVIEGLCSVGNNNLGGELSVTCKTGENEFKKHYLGLSNNVTYFAEQIKPANASIYYYRVIFKPSVIIPDIEVELP